MSTPDSLEAQARALAERLRQAEQKLSLEPVDGGPPTFECQMRADLRAAADFLSDPKE